MDTKTLFTAIICTLGASLYAQNTLPTTGNVGIGTTSPTNSLQIRKTTTQNGDLKLDGGRLLVGNATDYILEGQYRSKILTDGGINVLSTHPFLRLQINNLPSPAFSNMDMAIAVADSWWSNVAKKGDVVLKVSTYQRSLIFANEERHDGNDFKFTTRSSAEQWASTKLIIKNNGNIGIGTETPDSKLAVNGDIHAKEVRIDLAGWADYVFYDTYKLPTIDEAKQHIESKGHLINMPSAKQILSDGLNVGEITRLQQEKIEELMLYIIQMDKEIKDLKDELQSKKQ